MEIKDKLIKKLVPLGLVCGAQFSDDKAWYRALVLSVNSDETVDVNYVDYGNSERLPFSAVRKLPDSFLALPRQVRVMAMRTESVML